MLIEFNTCCFLLKLLHALQEVECSHIVRVSLSHLDEIDLELLIELLPKAEALVLRIREELKTLANP
jgi:hypothetical protein